MKKSTKNGWFWVPSLYLAEGLPLVIVTTLSVILYKRLGLTNTQIALYTGWLYLPWVIKPLWSPVVEVLGTKRKWIILMQFLIGVSLAGIGLSIPIPFFIQATLIFFWLLAFSSATHDIAADGFYMLGLNTHEQTFFVGVRSTFYRIAMIAGQGLLVLLAGYLEASYGPKPVSFQVEYHPQQGLTITPSEKDNPTFIKVVSLPLPANDTEVKGVKEATHEWNENHQFILKSDQQSLASQKESGGWWSKTISTPFGNWLKDHFSPAPSIKPFQKQEALLISLELNSPMEEALTLQFGKKRGSPDLKLVEGSRISFSQTNSNHPARALITTSPGLDREVSAIFEIRAGNISKAWSQVFGLAALLFLFFAIFHLWIFPFPTEDKPTANKDKGVFAELKNTLQTFIKKPFLGKAVLFILIYRLGEAQLVKLASPFLLDPREVGGLGLTTGQVGMIYGTTGLIALTLGGLLGGFVAARQGLKFWLWPMALAMNIPDLVYIYMSIYQPESLSLIGGLVMIEQFGYGFGFTAFMLYLLYFAEGPYKTAHYALATGLMALGMMIPGMLSGWLQDHMGYQAFFIWITLCTIPGLIMLPFLKIEQSFGSKK